MHDLRLQLTVATLSAARNVIGSVAGFFDDMSLVFERELRSRRRIERRTKLLAKQERAVREWSQRIPDSPAGA